MKAINIIILTIISFLRPSFPDLQSRFRHGTDRRTANGHQSPYGAGITNITYFSLVLISRFQFTFFQFIGFAVSSSLTQSLVTHRSNSPLYNGIIADVLSGFFDVFLFYRPMLIQQTKPTAVLCLTARFIYVRMIYFSERHLEFNGKCCTHHIGVITTCR